MERLQQEGLEPNHNLPWSVFSLQWSFPAFLYAKPNNLWLFCNPGFYQPKDQWCHQHLRTKNRGFSALPQLPTFVSTYAFESALSYAFSVTIKTSWDFLTLEHRVCDKMNLCSLGHGHLYCPRINLSPLNWELYFYTNSRDVNNTPLSHVSTATVFLWQCMRPHDNRLNLLKQWAKINVSSL